MVRDRAHAPAVSARAMIPQSWTPEVGVVIRPSASVGALRDLDGNEVHAALAEHGMVLLRGVPHDGLSDFEAFTQRFEVPCLRHGGEAHQPLGWGGGYRRSGPLRTPRTKVGVDSAQGIV